MLGGYAPVNLNGLAVKLFWVTFGNTFGGAILVTASYRVIFIWGSNPSDDKATLR